MTYKFSNLKSSIHSTLYTLCTQHSTQTTQTTLLPTIHYTLYTIHYTRVLVGESAVTSFLELQLRYAQGARHTVYLWVLGTPAPVKTK